MLRIDRLSVFIGCILSICAVCVASSAPLSKALDVADPATVLTSTQRNAALSLGRASRLIEEGKVTLARGALEEVRDTPSLLGYAELIQIRLLLKEGSHSLAYKRASQAIEKPAGEALHAALGVLQGEALAMGGDPRGAELAWKAVLGRAGAEDEAVQNALQLSIVASRQRLGNLDSAVDPLVLLDQSYAEVAVAGTDTTTTAPTAPEVLAEAIIAFDARRTERAIELFDRAIGGELDAEEMAQARMGRARALFRARRYEGASTAFAALLPEVEARFWLARTRARLDDVDASLVEFGRVAKGGNDEYASWALYLMGTLYEGRDDAQKAIDAFRRAADYEDFVDRARAASWREGWVEYRSGAHADAHTTLSALADRLEDPFEKLRPRYWAARAAILSGDEAAGRSILKEIAAAFPLTYYGWRARLRLADGADTPAEAKPALTEGTQKIEDATIERVALLIEADLKDLARNELHVAARDARGYADRMRVGALLVRLGDYHRANRLVLTAYADPLGRGLQSGRESLWWLSWPPAYESLIDRALSNGRAIDPELVWAIMREESHYRVDARSSVGALGLLQLMPATAAQLAKEQGLDSFETHDLFDPRTNIRLGSAYLAQLSKRFEGRVSAAIASYNAGPRRVATWLEGEGGKLEDDVWVEAIPFDQTRGYVKRVLRSMYVYTAFYRTESSKGSVHPVSN
jgi:soluble lytic murein transglycosylase-like protein